MKWLTKRKKEGNNFVDSYKLKLWWDSDCQTTVRTSLPPSPSSSAHSIRFSSGWLGPHGSEDGPQKAPGGIICMSGVSEHEPFSASIHMVVLALVTCAPCLSTGSEEWSSSTSQSGAHTLPAVRLGQYD